MVNMIRLEQYKETEDVKPLPLLKEHSKALLAFMFLFFGILLFLGGIVPWFSDSRLHSYEFTPLLGAIISGLLFIIGGLNALKLDKIINLYENK